MLHVPVLTDTVTQSITYSSSSGAYHPMQTSTLPNQLNTGALTSWASSVSTEFNRIETELNTLRMELRKLHSFLDYIAVTHPYIPDEYKRATAATAALEKANA